MAADESSYKVVIVGGGFAGLAAAKELARHDVPTLLIDRNGYHQFQPLLYQLATAQIGFRDIARPLHEIFRKHPSINVKVGEIAAVDTVAHSVTTTDGVTFQGEVLVLGCGAQPNFFGVPGADEHAFPLYSVLDANRLRSHIIGAFDAVDRKPEYLDKGGLEFVIVGGGPTGVETAGALAEFNTRVAPHFYPNPGTARAKVHLVDHGKALLNGFSESAHAYAADRLERDGVDLRMGVAVEAVTPHGVRLSDGTELETRTVVWAGGEKAAGLIAESGLPVGHGGRVDIARDLTIEGHPGVYVLGDAANVTDQHGQVLPQLGSVAQQSGTRAGKNILADLAGKSREDFHYHDKGIMAMIGRNAAIAEVGPHRHEVHGTIAFAAWLGLHAMLMSGVHERIDAFASWAWDYVSYKRPDALVDSPDAYVIDWTED